MTHRRRTRTARRPRPRARRGARQVTLSSGAEADYYVDLRRVTLHHQAAPLVGRLLRELTRDWAYAAVGGLTLGADPVADAVLHAAVAERIVDPAIAPVDAFVVRKATKQHGLQRRIEGPDIAGRPVLVVEDTSTTGGSVREALAAVREAGATVVGVAIGRRPGHRRPGDHRGRGGALPRAPGPRRHRPRLTFLSHLWHLHRRRSASRSSETTHATVRPIPANTFVAHTRQVTVWSRSEVRWWSLRGCPHRDGQARWPWWSVLSSRSPVAAHRRGTTSRTRSDRTYAKVPDRVARRLRQPQPAPGTILGLRADDLSWVRAYDADAAPSIDHATGIGRRRAPTMVLVVLDVPQRGARHGRASTRCATSSCPVSDQCPAEAGGAADVAGCRTSADTPTRRSPPATGSAACAPSSATASPAGRRRSSTRPPYTNDDASKLYLFIVRCSRSAIKQTPEQINDVASSFTVRETL